MPLLEVVGITKCFGGLVALDDVSLRVDPGEIVGLIGPNGAGKSTFFNVVSGVARPTRGRVLFRGEDITRMTSHRIAARGLVRTFQATTLFASLSVLENIYIACHVPSRTNVFGDVMRLPGVSKRESKSRERAGEIVQLVGLDPVTDELASNLSHGYQRALGIALALAASPTLLCLDEPVTGMNDEETRFMMSVVQRIRADGVTILLVEHAMRVVMGICDKVFVLNFGKLIAEGTCDQIQCDQNVIEAYLGRPEEDAAAG